MMSPTTESEDDDEIKVQETRVVKTSYNFSQVMNSYGRELCFILTLLFTAFAALQKGPLKSRKANPPEVFFSSPSLVTDYFLGNINALTSVLLEKEIAFVMYYAPWDSASIQTRDEFEITAKFFHHEVYFASVNCWWSEGECSQKFKLPSYPIIVTHIHEVGGVTYSGPLIANYMISFLEYVLSPLIPLQHPSELLNLQSKHEGVLVAFFDFESASQPKEYTQYYSASLKALSDDPTRQLCFSVITNRKVALKFKMKSAIQLYLWNTTEIYPENFSSSKTLLKWAFSKLNQVTRWITPSGGKGKMLSKILENATTLVMFTPRNMMLETSAFYDLFREVAMDYYNCNASSEITSLVHRIILKRHLVQEEINKLTDRCHINSSVPENASDRMQNLRNFSCCQSKHLHLISPYNSSCLCYVCLHQIDILVSKMNLSKCEKVLKLVLESFDTSELEAHQYCSEIELSFPVRHGLFEKITFKCQAKALKMNTKKLNEKYELPMEDILQIKDEHIFLMMRSLEKTQCNRLKLALNYSSANFPGIPLLKNSLWKSNFTGLGCQTNRTLRFIAMDTKLFHVFAENLGIDILKISQQTTAVIIEAEQESQYILTEPFNKRTIVEFIKNYTSGSLNRFLRSMIRSSVEVCETSNGNICVQEINTAVHLLDVINCRNDVVLFYYSSWCSSCSSIAHVFLSLANFFSDMKEITFARVNGEDNDFPWEYTVEKYPTIIFFPANKKSESVEFPPHLPITTTSLLHFILVHAQLRVRWVIAMQMCNKACIAHNLIHSSTEMKQLFRELHVLRNRLQFVQELLITHKMGSEENSDLKHIPYQTLFKETGSGTYDYLAHTKYLLSCIRDKKKKINQAIQLQNVLRKKQVLYSKRNSDSLSDSNSNIHLTKEVNAIYSSSKTNKDEL